MCTDRNREQNGSANRHRRRSHKEMMHGSAAFDSGKAAAARVYATDIPASPDDDDVNMNATKAGGIFSSSATRAVLAIASIVLLIISMVHLGANRAANLKDLSDTVMSLTKQLQSVELENEHNLKELATVEKDLEDARIELAWENQHVGNQKETQEMMYQSMVKQIKRDQEVISETTKVTSQMAHTGSLAAEEIRKRNQENTNLKHALANALEELAKARQQHPPPPGSDEAMNKEALERKLRGVNSGITYKPGDNIEIIEYQEGGKIALRPGIVSDILPDGSYNLVKLEASILLSGQQRKDFQTYHVYPDGTSAMFEEGKDFYSPITIVRFLAGSARKGFELHGAYQFFYDRDPRKRVREAQAMRIHRFAEAGEIVGESDEEL